jgi:Anti-sigma factor NepR
MTSEMKKGREIAFPEVSRLDEASSEPSLDRAIQSRIGDQLRAMYDNLMQQPIPDRLAELLGRLEQEEESKS